MRCTVVLGLILAATSPAIKAQWDIQNSGTTADLRGITSIGAGIAWASGTNGTVLRTEDGGYLWQRCTIPPGADKLDFRGIQAFDANTAIVMSSGPGDLSRLYKTTDGCQTWKLIATNPDKDGFWDAIAALAPEVYMVLGDPIQGHFVLQTTSDDGKTWASYQTSPSQNGEGAFAASNSSLLNHEDDEEDGPLLFVTGGPLGARIFRADLKSNCSHKPSCPEVLSSQQLPMFAKGEGAGIFSIAEGPSYSAVAVGGNYQKPNESSGTAAFITGKHWQASTTPPHGYRSAVAYDASTKTWITVGPNGTDISTDDGHNWRALKPTSTEQPDADQHWNALSLPFVVGPHGRIGVLNPAALKGDAK